MPMCMHVHTNIHASNSTCIGLSTDVKPDEDELTASTREKQVLNDQSDDEFDEDEFEDAQSVSVLTYNTDSIRQYMAQHW